MTSLITGSVVFSVVQVEIAHSPRRSEERKYRVCILMPGNEKGERVITISFPVFSSDRNINIIRDN